MPRMRSQQSSALGGFCGLDRLQATLVPPLPLLPHSRQQLLSPESCLLVLVAQGQNRDQTRDHLCSWGSRRPGQWAAGARSVVRRLWLGREATQQRSLGGAMV